jgi:hypothetical protein
VVEIILSNPKEIELINRLMPNLTVAGFPMRVDFFTGKEISANDLTVRIRSSHIPSVIALLERIRLDANLGPVPKL